MRTVSFFRKTLMEILISYFESEWKLNDNITSHNQHNASYVEKNNYLELKLNSHVMVDFCQIKLFPVLFEKMLIFNWMVF